MFNDPFRGHIRKSVSEEAEIELSGDEETNAIWQSLLAALNEWKQQHGNRDPQNYPEGLLGFGVKPVDFDAAMPWQCTDYPFENATSLTLRLLYEGFPSVIAIRDKVSELKMMAALLIKDDGGTWDWFSAYRRMLHSRIPEARKAGALGALLENWDKIRAHDQQQAALANGRKKGVEKRKEVAAEKQRALTKAISDLFDVPDKPGWGWGNQEIVSFLKRNFNYTDGTILAKVKKEVAKYRKARREDQASKLPNR